MLQIDLWQVVDGFGQPGESVWPRQGWSGLGFNDDAGAFVDDIGVLAWLGDGPSEWPVVTVVLDSGSWAQAGLVTNSTQFC